MKGPESGAYIAQLNSDVIFSTTESGISDAIRAQLRRARKSLLETSQSQVRDLITSDELAFFYQMRPREHAQLLSAYGSIFGLDLGSSTSSGPLLESLESISLGVRGTSKRARIDVITSEQRS